jgi:quercetin dioxygenase-like cupin family protein
MPTLTNLYIFHFLPTKIFPQIHASRCLTIGYFFTLRHKLHFFITSLVYALSNSSYLTRSIIMPNNLEQPELQTNKGNTEEAGSLIVFDLHTLTRFQEDHPYVQVLSDIGAARLVLFAFRAGQQLKEHTTSSQIIVQVLQGRITFTATGQSVKLHDGMLIQLEATLPHSITAETDAVVLLTLTPSPSQHSLNKELFQNRLPLVTRATRSTLVEHTSPEN